MSCAPTVASGLLRRPWLPAPPSRAGPCTDSEPTGRRRRRRQRHAPTQGVSRHGHPAYASHLGGVVRTVWGQQGQGATSRPATVGLRGPCAMSCSLTVSVFSSGSFVYLSHFARMLRRHLDLLIHSCECKKPDCVINCHKMRELLAHVHTCTIRSQVGTCSSTLSHCLSAGTRVQSSLQVGVRLPNLQTAFFSHLSQHNPIADPNRSFPVACSPPRLSRAGARSAGGSGCSCSTTPRPASKRSAGCPSAHRSGRLSGTTTRRPDGTGIASHSREERKGSGRGVEVIGSRIARVTFVRRGLMACHRLGSFYVL